MGMYIPSGSAHAVQNLDDVIAISANYLDGLGLKHHLEVTCHLPLWSESQLCWGYNHDFLNHKSPLSENLRELTYFEYAGFKGSADWCESFLPDLKKKIEKRSELQR